MGTKRLSRTVIEGGRGHYNKFIRRHSHRQQRAAERRYLRQVLLDPELAEAAPEPVLQPVGKWFYDRLAAAERWLASHAGEPWDEVRSAIFARFDTRSLAGRHIVFDHLLPSPWWRSADGSWRVNRRWRFRIDDEGILVAEQHRRQPGRWRFPYWKLEHPHPSAEALAFVGERRIGLRGHHAYWVVDTRYLPREERRCGDAGSRPARYRQGAALSERERMVFDRLRPEDRLAIVVPLEAEEGDTAC